MWALGVITPMPTHAKCCPYAPLVHTVLLACSEAWPLSCGQVCCGCSGVVQHQLSPGPAGLLLVPGLGFKPGQLHLWLPTLHVVLWVPTAGAGCWSRLHAEGGLQHWHHCWGSTGL